MQMEGFWKPSSQVWFQRLVERVMLLSRGKGTWEGNILPGRLWIVQISSVQLLSHVQLLATPWIAACQTSLSITSSWSLLKLMSVELVMPSNHLVLYYPLLLLSSTFPSIRVFCNESASHGQSTEASALVSILPMNIQDWFPLGLTGWISLQSKGLSRVFSNTTVQSINSLVLSFLYGPTLTSINDSWKNHSFDHTYFCEQSKVVSFTGGTQHSPVNGFLAILEFLQEKMSTHPSTLPSWQIWIVQIAQGNYNAYKCCHVGSQ